MTNLSGTTYLFATMFSKVDWCWLFKSILPACGKISNFLFYLNPFPHTTILQQTALNIFCQEMENLYNWMNNLWLKVENIVAIEEIARFEQFLLFSLCFQKAVCCRGARKRLYEGKGLCLQLQSIISFIYLPRCYKRCMLKLAAFNMRRYSMICDDIKPFPTAETSLADNFYK